MTESGYLSNVMVEFIQLLINRFLMSCTVQDAKKSIYGHDAFLEHRCSMLHDSVSTREFGWVLPMPGLLHIEMNACKAFF